MDVTAAATAGLWAVLAAVQHELLLFCAVFFALGALDDLALDCAWATRAARRPQSFDRLPTPAAADRLAVLIPAWREAGVIGATLTGAARAWSGQPVTVFVGVYRNDPAGIAEVLAVAARHRMIRPVLLDADGPTSKAHCLNRLWLALRSFEERHRRRFRAVALHDAEDHVHPGEVRLYLGLMQQAQMVQLPVLPLLHRGGGRFADWMAGHYADEFAEAHGKQLAARARLCPGFPAAGTACAFDRALLGRLAQRRGDAPFAADSLTEDYELGLIVPELGGRAMLADVRDAGGRVAVRAYFPHRIDAAVRQKSRWITGIALAGWDRIGWRGRLSERWMLLRDRRAPLAALVLTAGYMLALVTLLLVAGGAAGLGELVAPTPLTANLMLFNAGALVLRLAMRMVFTARAYGLAEGLAAVPRALVSNMVAILAARRALLRYAGAIAGRPLAWEATRHKPPPRIESGEPHWA